MFFEKTQIFQDTRGFIEQTCFFKEGLSVRRTDLIISLLHFPQNPYLILKHEHIPTHFPEAYFLFEDDSYIHKKIETVNDAVVLQNNIDDLVKWENEWSAEFHPDKCKMLRTTNKQKTLNHKYHIYSHKLESVSKAKYLGVTLPIKCHGRPTL